MKALTALFILGVIACSNAVKINYKDCGSSGMVKFVDVSPCEKQPCVLKYGSNVNVTIDFMAKMSTKTLTAELVGIIDGEQNPQPLPNPDACQSGVKCPVKPGLENMFHQSIYIEYDFPQGQLQVELDLEDDNYNKVACVMFPATIS